MIKGLSDQRRMPRLGKLHLGIKTTNDKGTTYPKAVDWFVCPEEVQAIYGEKPKALDIMFPVEDAEQFASQFYKCYSSYRGLVCKGDGSTCIRMVDVATGDFAHRDTKEVTMRDCQCDGQDCPMYKEKKCKEVMNLQFLLPQVPGLGVWQLDTGSYHSIVAINSAIDLIRNVCGRVSMIPLKLTLEPKEVNANGVKKTVQILSVRTDITLAAVQRLAALPGNQVLLPPPDEEKPDLLYPPQEEEIVDPAWQDIVDGKVEKPAEKPAEKPQDAQPAKKAAPAKEMVEPVSVKPTLTDPATIKTLGDLFNACLKDFKLSKPQALKELGYTSQSDISDTPADCYLRILATREG